MTNLPMELAEALNQQITRERHNREFYRAAAADLDVMNFPGMSAFMLKHSNEENGHAEKLIQYMCDRSARPYFKPLESVDFGTITSAQYFQYALDREVENTAQLNALHELALAFDQQTAVLLEWFLTEQVEEEKVFEEICDQFNYAGSGLGEIIMDTRLKSMV